MRRIIAVLGTMLLFTLTAAVVARAQSRNASVVGTVTDSSGAVVPGVKVTVTNVNTGEVSQIRT
jgi:ABC-type transporter Mla subunit MlaD